MNKIRRPCYFAFYIVALLFVFSGCSPLIVPAPYHVPAVEDKGDLNLNVLTGISEFNVQAAYLPFINAVINSSYSTNLAKHNTNGNIYRQTSIGAGYVYKPRKTQWVIMGGYSWGKSRDNTTSTHNQIVHYYSTQVNYNNIYLQPYFNMLVSNNINVYGGIRTSLIWTKNFYTNDEPDRVSPGKTGTFEPFAGLRAGFRRLKFEIQYGIYSHANTHENSILTTDNVLNTHVGIGYTFGSTKKSTK